MTCLMSPFKWWGISYGVTKAIFQVLVRKEEVAMGGGLSQGHESCQVTAADGCPAGTRDS